MKSLLPQTLLIAATLSTLCMATSPSPSGLGQPASDSCNGGEIASITTIQDSFPTDRPKSDDGLSNITTEISTASGGTETLSTATIISSSPLLTTGVPIASTVPTAPISALAPGPISYNSTFNGSNSGLNSTGTGLLSINLTPTASSQVGLLVATGNPSKTSASGKPTQSTSGAAAMRIERSVVMALVGIVGWSVSL